MLQRALILLLLLMTAEISRSQDFLVEAQKFSSGLRKQDSILIDPKILEQWSVDWRKAAGERGGDGSGIIAVQPLTKERLDDFDKFISESDIITILKSPEFKLKFDQTYKEFHSKNPSLSQEKVLEYGIPYSARVEEDGSQLFCLWPFGCRRPKPLPPPNPQLPGVILNLPR